MSDKREFAVTAKDIVLIIRPQGFQTAEDKLLMKDNLKHELKNSNIVLIPYGYECIVVSKTGEVEHL